MFLFSVVLLLVLWSLLIVVLVPPPQAAGGARQGFSIGSNAEVVNWACSDVILYGCLASPYILPHWPQACFFHSFLKGWIGPGSILGAVRHHAGESSRYSMVKTFQNLQHGFGNCPSLGSKQQIRLDDCLVEHTFRPGGGSFLI